MTQVKVLYQKTPMWRVGEDRPPSTSADLAARLEEFSALGAAERYPNDYSGRVISVLPADREFSPADLADPRRGVVLMDDDDGLRSKRLKIVREATEDVTFDDRWGAVSAELAKTWDDPEIEEKFAAAEVTEAKDENRRRDADHERALAEWRETVAECLELGTVIDTPAPRHAGHVVVPENRFDVEAARVMQLLPQTVTHTGAGLYKVQAAGTMATPAHLWAMDAVDPPDIGTPGGNPGTGSNVTVVGGQIGSALDFDGNDSNVNVGDVVELNVVQKLTMAFRMNQDALDQNAVLFRKQGASSSYRVTLQPAADGQFYFIIANGANTFGRFDYSTRINAGEWHHVAVVFDGSLVGDANRLKVYVDGIPVTLIFSGPIPATTADLSGVDATISWGAAPNAFNGKIDDFRIYANEAFTDAQVKDLAGRGLAHWDTIVSSVKDNGTSTITLTTGTSEDRTGEVFVSGGNAYAVSAKIDDTHITVIGDASGESGTCSISPYTTIQSALDQLWADQGAAAFTETQYVRVFAGTYDENVEPNGGLVTAWGQYALIVEGDPTDDRDDVILAPSSGIAWECAVDTTVLRHMKVVSASAGTFCVYFKAGGQKPTAADLHVISDDVDPIYIYYAGVVEDCVLEQTRDAAGAEGIFCRVQAEVRRCTVTNSAPTTRGRGIQQGQAGTIEGCSIAGYDTGIQADDSRSSVILRLRNNTIYNCDKGIWISSTAKGHELDMQNCILSTVGTCLYLGSYPDESGGLFGPSVTLRNNVFHNYTTFADDGSTTKTHAEFIALSRCDASGDLDNTDPLMTDPGAGDFSLQAASPCRGTGHGSGVVAYVDGTAADANHPNIGAEGLATDPPAPAWTAGLSGITATDERVGDEIALAWGAASIGGAGLSIEYGVQQRIGAGAWTTVWIGSGTSTHVCECTTGQLYQFRVGARCADYEQAWVYPTDSATATATLPVPPTVSDWTVSGTTVTVTLVGVAGRTYRARLMDGAGGEDDEQGRTGSGDIALTAAGYGARYFIAWEVSDGVMSEPTGVYAVTIDDPADADVAYYRVRTVMALPGAPHKTAILERIKRPIQP